MSLNGHHLGFIVDTKVEEYIKDHPMIMYLQFDFNETVLPEKKIFISFPRWSGPMLNLYIMMVVVLDFGLTNKTQLSYCESIFFSLTLQATINGKIVFR